MSVLTITLLVLGAVLLIASFFIPDIEEKESKKDIELQREEIRRLLESELDGMKLRVNEVTNETVEYGMDKYERSLEKIANEKIMAVGEYATTVLEEIDKNHKEVLFLYDMLNDKQTDVKNTVRNAEATVREISDATRNANEAVANAVNSASVVKADMEARIEEYNEKTDMWKNQRQFGSAGQPQESGNARRQVDGRGAGNVADGRMAGQMAGRTDGRIDGRSYVNQNAGIVESVFTKFDSRETDDSDNLITPINALKAQDSAKQPAAEVPDEFAELQKTTFKNVSNNNQQIIMLNKEGKSVIEIAKQLGLGVGEVQLVLDLFK